MNFFLILRNKSELFLSNTLHFLSNPSQGLQCFLFYNFHFRKETEATTEGVLLKKVLLKISQYSQEKSCARVSFLIKLQASLLKKDTTLLEKKLWYRCFPVNFAKFLRSPFYSLMKMICEIELSGK